MARIGSWKGAEVFGAIQDRALENANAVMDDVVVKAKMKCPIDPTVRAGGWGPRAFVSFIPKRGRNKGERVTFMTDRRWVGREPGNLKDTIRRVNKPQSGNIRVYCGSYKIYWAFMVEKSGYHDRSGKWHKPKPFLRQAFHSEKKDMIRKIKGGV